MKILFPHDGATKEEIEELLRFAIEGRKRVKDQQMRIDSTYGNVRFSCQDAGGQAKPVTTHEEEEYPGYYHKAIAFMEFLETVVKHKVPDEEVSVRLVTTEDEFKGEQQKDNFEKMKESASSVGVNFTWEFDGTGTIHARHILTDHGWKISLDRGLDIFQHYEMNDAFTFAHRLQQYRPSKAFEVTFIKHKREA